MINFEDNLNNEIEKLTEEQIDNYYQNGITDGLSDEQRTYLYFKDQAEAYADVMGDASAPESPDLPDARLWEQGYGIDELDYPDMEGFDDTPTSPVLKGREGLTIPAKEDRMLEIKWADYWNKNGKEWGVQVHGTHTAEVVDGFYEFKANNPDIPNWWFPRDFMNGQQLTQRAFVGWGVTQEDIDNLKEGFEKGIFDKEKDKKLLELVNDLDGSDNLIKSIDTPTNVADDFVEQRYSNKNLPNVNEQELSRLAKSIGVENVDKLKAFGGIGLKVLGYLDEEILLTKPLELASRGLKAAGYSKAAAGAVTGAAGIAAYETYWMLANIGMAAYAQLQGEMRENNPELQNLIGNAMMSSATGVTSNQPIDVDKNKKSVPFNNAAQLEKDMRRWARGSLGVQAYQATIGKVTNTEDIVSMAMKGIRPMLGANE